MPVQFAKRMQNLKASEIREILKITQRPEVISFAGGLPAPELFPVAEIKKVALQVLDEDGAQALQYTTTEGYGPLRKQIAARMNKNFKTDITYENIMIISGSQQGLDFAGKIFLDEGDVILCESPTYLAAINAFKAYRPRFIEIPTDQDGMVIEELKNTLINCGRVKLIYVIPDFQNPTGRTWSMERRIKFMEVIKEYEIPVIEDNPYGELRFDGQISPALKAMDEKGLVTLLGTFSKIFCPGYRIGWVAADKKILEKFILVKQSADLQSSTIGQREIAKYIENYDIDAHIKKIKAVYKRRRDLMITIMQQEFPDGVKFNNPEGGLFTWVELPVYIDAKELLMESLKKNVAFVPGGPFYPHGGNENTLRLNYSNMPEDRIVEGIKRLAGVLRDFM